MSGSSLKKHFRFITFFTIGIVMVITTLLVLAVSWQMSRRVSADYARLYTSELAGNLNTHLSTEITLARKAASTIVIQRWLQGENDPDLKAQAFAEMENFTWLFGDKNIFVACDASQQVYFLDARNNSTHTPLGRLDPPENTRDAWYDTIRRSSEPYNLNIDTDRFLNILRVWINVRVVREDGKFLGVIGTGLNLDPLKQTLFPRQGNEGARTLIVDDQGLIQLDSAPDTTPGGNRTLFSLIRDEDFLREAGLYLHGSGQPQVLRLNHQDYQYAALAPVLDTRWHVITLYDGSALLDPWYFLPLIFLIIGVTLLLALLMFLLVQRQFFHPFERLRASIMEKEATLEHTLFGLEREDEFGELSRTIQQMSDRLVRAVPVGMFLCGPDAQFLYGNPHFLAQFLCSTPEAFRQFTDRATHAPFTSEGDAQQFRSIFETQLEQAVLEKEMLRTDGSRFWAEIRLTRVPDETDGWRYEGILLNVQRTRDYVQSLVAKAETDSLTGLYNRLRFDRLLTEEAARMDRLGGTASLLILDLDHFKHVNDTWGHDTGDSVLCHAADLIRRGVRQQDLPARWGGEEFAVLLPGTGISGALHAAEKLRLLLARTSHATAGIITASIGVAQRLPHESCSAWFHRADQALYTAKTGGRNQVREAVSAMVTDPHLVRLVWQTNFNSGHPDIDQQHQLLFNQANALLDATLRGQGPDIVIPCLTTLHHHLRQHFAGEEKILRTLALPEDMESEHLQDHARLLMHFEALSQQITAGVAGTGDLLVSLVQDVVVGHMLRKDTLFFPYLRPPE